MRRRETSFFRRIATSVGLVVYICSSRSFVGITAASFIDAVPALKDVSVGVVPSWNSEVFKSLDCSRYSNSTTCKDVKVREMPSNPDPQLKILSVSRGDPVANQPLFNPADKSFSVALPAGETVTFGAIAPFGTFVSAEPPLPSSGAVDGYVLMPYTPKGEVGSTEIVQIYVTNYDKSSIASYDVNVTILQSTNPKMSSLSISPGRLEPAFMPSIYTYYARVPEGTVTVSVSFASLAKGGSCSVEGRELRKDYGSETVDIAAGGFFAHGGVGVVTIDCFSPNSDNRIRYTLTVVHQEGGSTMLKRLEPVGGTMSPYFDPTWGGPYSIDLGFQQQRDLRWMAFDIKTVNDRAIVKIDGKPVSLVNGISPYYKINSGTSRKFRITVRTPENIVEESYVVIVHRPSSTLNNWTYHRVAGDILGWISVIVSGSSGATSFMNNIKFLQFLSVTHWLNKNPEGYDAFTQSMHKWNAQWKLPSKVSYIESYPVDVQTVSDVPLGAPLPPVNYNEMLKQFDDSPILSDNQINRAHTNLDSVVNEVVAALKRSDFFSESSPEDDEVAKVYENSPAVALPDEPLNRVVRKVLGEHYQQAIEAALTHEDDHHDSEVIVGRRMRRLYSVLEEPRRILMPITALQKTDLIRRLDVEHKQQQKLLLYTSSISITTSIIATLAVVYFFFWVIYLRSPQDFFAIRRAYVSWMHPSRFWTFVLDFALISYTQACVGLMKYNSGGTVIDLFGYGFTPKGFVWFILGAFIIFPITFVSFGAFILSMISRDIVWSRCLNRHHDRRCYEASAQKQYLSWLPAFLRQFFVFEIVGVLPLCRPADQEGDGDIIFNDESCNNAPWHRADPSCAVSYSGGYHNVAAGGTRGYESLVTQENMGCLQYDKTKDRVRVQLLEVDPDAGVWEPYEVSNDRAMKDHPDATVAYESFRVKNAYDRAMEVEVEVQLKHFPKIVQTTENYTMWVPYKNLRMEQGNSWGQLYEKSPRGLIYAWVVDRGVTTALVAMLNGWLDATGMTQKLLLIGTSIILAGAYLPGAISGGVGRWFKLMQHEVYKMEKANRKEKTRQQAMKTWPFEIPEARQKLARDVEREKSLWCGLYGPFSKYVMQPAVTMWDGPVFKTRAWLTTREIMLGPVASELFKALIVFELVIGGRYIGALSEGVAATAAYLFASAAICSLNYNEIEFFANDCVRILNEMRIHSNRTALSIFDFLMDPLSLGLRLQHSIVQSASAFIGRSNHNLSFPGRAAGVKTRDYSVEEVSIIQNELGLHFAGRIRSDKGFLERSEESTVNQMRRFELHKTLYQYGKIGEDRLDADRSMPMQLSFRQYYCRRHDLPEFNVSRLSATIQIVNHTHLRFPLAAGRRYNSEDDSFLSLYTDPKLLPPLGDITIRKKHGYSVLYNPELNQLTFRGPAVRRGRNYTATSHGAKLPRHRIRPRNDSLDSSSLEGGASVSTAETAWSDRGSQGSAAAKCTEAGLLVVKVPLGSTPNMYLPINVVKPSGKTFTINPLQIQVVYSSMHRELVLSNEQFMPVSDDYEASWTVMNKTVNVKGTGVAQDPGVVTIQLEGPGMPNLTKMITLRDERDAVITVDPRQTDVYHAMLPPKEHSGLHNAIFRVGAAHRSYLKHLTGASSTQPAFPETVPCTIIQCVDPVKGTMRVEPNFYAYLAAQRASLAQIEAKLASLDDRRGVAQLVAAGVLPMDQLISVFKDIGIKLEQNGQVLNPINDQSILKMSPQQMQDAEPRVRAALDTLLRGQAMTIKKKIAQAREWIKSYADSRLIGVQYKRDLTESAAASTSSEIMMNLANLRGVKGHVESEVSNFHFPLTVDSKLLCRKPNHYAQIKQWQDQVEKWLADEETSVCPAAEMEIPRSKIKNLSNQIMAALKRNLFKGEDISRGEVRSMLHFMCDSVSIRGTEINWKPDPICTSNARVRVFRSLSNGRADFSHPVWMPCLVKLSANAVKILMPAHRDPDREFKSNANSPWRHISGYYIPLKCFQKVEVSMDPVSPIEKEQLDMTGCVDTKIVFRKNQMIPIDDRYVRRVEDDQFDNELHVAVASDNAEANRDSFETYTFMIGHCIGGDSANNWPQTEVDPVIRSYNNKINVHPLTFRCGASLCQKWQDTIRAAQMDTAPKKIDESFNGGVTMPAVTSSSSSSSSASSSYAEPILTSSSSEEESIMLPPPTGVSRKMDSFAPPPLPQISSSSPSSESPSSSSSSSVKPQKRDLTDPTPAKPVVEEAPSHGRPKDGRGKLYDKSNKTIFDGNFRNFLRDGDGVSYFHDERGREWCYDGTFTHDYPTGPGFLKLTDEKEVDRLSGSKSDGDKWQIVNFQGTYKLPDNVRQQRGKAGGRKAPKAGSSSSSSSSASKMTDKAESTPDIDLFADPNGILVTLPRRVKVGVALYANGAHYEGLLRDAKPHGRGFFCAANSGMKYDGAWKNGRPHGRGIMISGSGKNEMKYVGKFKNGKRNGSGALRSEDGDTYVEGKWREDHIWSGQSVLIFSKLKQHPFMRYSGPMSDGTLNGDAKMVFHDGSVYSGGFSGSQRHGKGQVVDKGGKEAFIGMWQGDLPHGKASKSLTADGQIYSGNYVKGKRQGLGELFSRDGKIVYEGTWKADKADGRGTLFTAEGEYDGEFVYGRRQGKGKFVYQEHPTSGGKPRYYYGDWDKDVQSGQGIYLNEHGKVINHSFKDGELAPGWEKQVQTRSVATCGVSRKPKKGVKTTVPSSPSPSGDGKYWGSKLSLNDKTLEKTLGELTHGSAWLAVEQEPFKCKTSPPSDITRPSPGPMKRPSSFKE